MEQTKKPGIAEAIGVVKLVYDLMLSDMDKEPHNVMAIMHDWHQELIRTLEHMERASVPEPEPEPPTLGHSQRTSTGDSKNGGGSSPSRVSKAASSEASFAAVRAWLERNEQEYTSASEAESRAGSSSSQENKAASSTASFATVRAWLEHIEQEKTSASEAQLRAGVASSHDNTANSTKASFASLRRPEHDAYEHDDHSEGDEFSTQSMIHPLPRTTFS